MGYNGLGKFVQGVGIGLATLVFLGVLIFDIDLRLKRKEALRRLEKHREPATQPVPTDLCQESQVLTDELGGSYAICVRRMLDGNLRIIVLRPNNDVRGGWQSDGFLLYKTE